MPERVNRRRKGAAWGIPAKARSASGASPWGCNSSSGRMIEVSIFILLVEISRLLSEGEHSSKTDVSVGSACLQVTLWRDGRNTPSWCLYKACNILSSIVTHAIISISQAYDARRRNRAQRAGSLSTVVLTNSSGSTNWQNFNFDYTEIRKIGTHMPVRHDPLCLRRELVVSESHQQWMDSWKTSPKNT